MTELIENLPGDWERDRVSEEPNPTYTYRHQYLDVEVSVLAMDAEDIDPELDAEYSYSISLRWAADVVGVVEDFFDGPGEITTRGDARDWTLALLTQIEQQFEPGDTDYVSRAMSSTMGQQTAGGSSGRVSDAETCPACDAPFFQFRGMDTYEQAQNHFAYMDDEEHEGWDVSLEERP
jgi:hypothetical protein